MLGSGTLCTYLGGNSSTRVTDIGTPELESGQCVLRSPAVPSMVEMLHSMGVDIGGEGRAHEYELPWSLVPRSSGVIINYKRGRNVKSQNCIGHYRRVPSS